MAHKTLTLRAVAQEQRFDADGDILAPLRAVRDAYLRKAAELDEKAYGDNRAKIQAVAARYRDAAAAVERLIGPETVVEYAPLPVSTHDAGLGAVSA